MRKTTRCLGALLGWWVMTAAMAQAPGDKAWIKLEKAIARGDQHAPAQAVVAYGEQALPLLLTALSARDDALREAAAGELRDLARRQSDSARLREAMPAMRAALRDPDGEVVTTLASALALLGDTDAALAEPRRAVLRSGESRPHVRFNAARGLIGLDPDPALLPDLLAFLFDNVPGNNRGNWDVEHGIIENHDLAMEALVRLVQRGDRRLIPPLASELDTAHPVVPSIMRVLAAFDPDPEDWPQLLLDLTRSPGDNIREVAWELLGEAQAPEQLSVWWPAALAALDDADARAAALGALLDLRGVRADGLERVAALLLDRSIDTKQRETAAEILYDASNDNLGRGDAATKAAARRITHQAYRDLLASEPAGELFEDVDDKLPHIGLEDLGVAELALAAAERNPDVAAKVVLLKSVAWSSDRARPLFARVQAFTQSPDAAVKDAALTALDALDAAWRARDARQAAVPAATNAGAAGPSPSATHGGGIPVLARAAAQALLKQRKLASGFPGLYEAIRRGDAEAVAAQIDAGVAINQPAQLAPAVQFKITPLQAVVDYCHVTELVPQDKLLAMARALLGRGADPAVRGSRERGALETAVDNHCPQALIDVLIAGR
jgi:hypothetical protein